MEFHCKKCDEKFSEESEKEKEKPLCGCCHKIIEGQIDICYYCSNKIHFRCVYAAFFNNDREQCICWDCRKKVKPIEIEI